VGDLAAPLIYGAGLLSSVGEAARCLGPAVERRPLDTGCTEVAFDITRMQPKLFVARDFEQLFEVLEDFAATLSFRRGGDHGLGEAIRSRTVVQLALSAGRELSGRVVDLVPAGGPVGPGLSTALARLDGPVLRSRGGRAEEGWFDGPALVAFGATPPLPAGRFRLALGTGLALSGFHRGDGEVLELAGSMGSRPLPLPRWALLELSEGLASVAGGPADAEA
jgi:phenylalanine-4-hydroxylase